jgi:hypothetical protein
MSDDRSEYRRAEEQLQELEGLAAQLRASQDNLDRYSRSSFSHITRLKEHWRDPVSGAEIDRIAAEVLQQTELAKAELSKLTATLMQSLAQAEELLVQKRQEEDEREAGRDREDDDERRSGERW